MKSFIVLAVLVAAAMAVPIDTNEKAVILRFDNDNIGVGGYSYGHESSNGISAQEEGQIQGVGTEDEGMEVRGQFTYIGDDGVTYTVTYTAGRGGFQPSGAHIPQ